VRQKCESCLCEIMMSGQNGESHKESYIVQISPVGAVVIKQGSMEVRNLAFTRGCCSRAPSGYTTSAPLVFLLQSVFKDALWTPQAPGSGLGPDFFVWSWASFGTAGF
jgi:hypothetical protein